MVPQIGRQLWLKLSLGVLAIQASIEMMVAVLVGTMKCSKRNSVGHCLNLLTTLFAVAEEKSRGMPTRQCPTLPPLVCAAASIWCAWLLLLPSNECVSVQAGGRRRGLRWVRGGSLLSPPPLPDANAHIAHFRLLLSTGAFYFFHCRRSE